MNIALFYQLRERLCASAIAGCDVISEDFRLKRAIEEFEPLAKANKVFGRLYAMCGELFTSDKPAPLLADCIALCDALAVTQGTFKDNSETSESVGVVSCEPSDIRYSSLKHEQNIESRDPRVINDYLNKLKANPSEYTKNFIMNFGKDLVPALKQCLDMKNAKESRKIVLYVGVMSGAEENDWYISIIENEDNPLAVREVAVGNLAYDKSNADRLVELYRTGKAKIKDAAALALVQLDVPEAEIILTKVTSEKFLKKNADLISISSNKIAVDFAVDYAEKWLEQEKNNSKKIAYDYDLVVKMLANKTGIEDILNKIAVHNTDSSNIQLAEMLIKNLGRHKQEEYRILIENLFNKNPNYFTMPYLFMIMTEDRGTEITDFPELVDKYRYNLLSSLYMIKYDNVKKCYTLRPQISGYEYYSDSVVKSVPITDDKFEKILDLISDTSYMKKSLLKLRLTSRKYFDYTTRTVKGDGYTDECVFMAYRTFEYLYDNASPDDKERICSVAVDFCKIAMKYFPRDYLLHYLCKYDVQYIRDNPDLLENMIMFRMKNFGNIVRATYFDEIPRDVLDVIMPKIYINLKTKKFVGVSKDILSLQIHAVERFMISKGYDTERILKGNE